MARLPLTFTDSSAPGFDLREAMRTVGREHGKSPLAQTLDLARLISPPHRLSPFEYYSFGLFDDRRHPWPGKTRFIGRRARLYRRLRDRRWSAIADDKILFHAMLQGMGVPAPALLAVYSAHGRRAGGIPSFNNPDALADFLRNGIRYPFFGKPAQGVYGQGAVSVTGYDAASDSLQFANGARDRIEEFVRGLLDPAGMGYLFQEVVAPHPDLAAITGGRLPVVRLDIFWGAGDPRVVFAKAALPVGRNSVSNFMGGSLGNLFAIVDPDDGSMGPVITHCTWNAMTTVETHPDTGCTLAGTILPHWPEIRAFGLHLARLIPGLRLQSWDIALSEHGPVALEINLGGDSLFIGQRLTGRGFIDDEVRSFASDRPVS